MIYYLFLMTPSHSASPPSFPLLLPGLPKIRISTERIPDKQLAPANPVRKLIPKKLSIKKQT